MRVMAIDGSPTGSGRTQRVLEQMLDAVTAAGATTSLLSLADQPDAPSAETISQLATSDAFIISSPVYRGSYSATLKSFLDRLPRGMWGESDAPITGRPVAIVLTGATWHHYLALNDLRNVLAGFFSAHVLSPGIYVPAEGFDGEKQLTDPYRRLAHDQGRALVEFAAVVSASAHLRAVRPQA